MTATHSLHRPPAPPKKKKKKLASPVSRRHGRFAAASPRVPVCSLRVRRSPHGRLMLSSPSQPSSVLLKSSPVVFTKSCMHGNFCRLLERLRLVIYVVLKISSLKQGVELMLFLWRETATQSQSYWKMNKTTITTKISSSPLLNAFKNKSLYFADVWGTDALFDILFRRVYFPTCRDRSYA